jgi:hypothetical protein
MKSNYLENLSTTEPTEYKSTFLQNLEVNPVKLGPQGFDTTFSSRFNEGLVDGYDPNEIRRGNQKWYDLVGSSALNTASELGLGIAEGFSYLGDLEQWKNQIEGTEREYTNWFADLMKQAKEQVKTNVAPIYTNEEDQGFKPLSARWWATNMPAVGSTLSLLVPATAASKGAMAATKGLKLENILSKVSPTLLKEANLESVGSAVFSRYMEGTMEANQALQATYEAALEAGKTEDEAKQIAGEAAAGTFNKNLTLLGFDIYQYNKMFKAFSSAAKQGVKYGVLKEVAKQGLSEGAEEVFQYVAGKESEREALVNNDVIKDDSSFYDRVMKYAKDGELWTSFVFGALGGAGFGGIAEFNSNKTARAKSEVDDLIKPSFEYEKAAVNNDEVKANYVQDEAFMKLAVANAKNGTLSNTIEHLDTWSKDQLAKTDEQLAQEGTDKETIQNTLVERKAQLEYANQLQQEIDKDNTLSPRHKEVKFAASLGKYMSNQRKTAANTKVESILQSINTENELTPELSELKKLRALRNGYIDAKMPEVAKSYNSKIEAIQNQIKQLDPNIDIKTKMESSQNEALNKAVEEFIQHQNNQEQFDSELKKLTTEDGLKELDQEFAESAVGHAEDKYNNIVNSITPNTSSFDIEKYQSIANKNGKGVEFEEFYNSYISGLQNESGKTDLSSSLKEGKLTSNIGESLKQRYKNKNLLFDYELQPLREKLGVNHIDEDIVNQKYNENPKTRKIIADYFTDINNKIDNRLESQNPTFTATENPEYTNIEVQVANNMGVENSPGSRVLTKFKYPFLTVGEEFAFRETTTGWITEYDVDGPNKGNPRPSTKENIVNWEEANKPDFGKKGTTVEYEYDPNSRFNNTEQGKKKNQREIQIVVYKDGNVFNKVDSNRIVIGTLPAYDVDANWSDQSEALFLKALRDAIEAKIKAGIPTNTIVNLGITSKVNEKLPGRVRFTGTYNRPHDILNNGESLIYGIGRIVNSKKYLEIPGLPSGVIDYNPDNISSGSTYIIIPTANGKLVPIQLFTKKLGELPEQYNKAQGILSKIKTQEDWVNAQEALRQVVGFPKDSITYNGQVVVRFDNKWTNLTDEVLGNLIAQVDIRQINKGDYNKKISESGILSTNISPNNHFHSTKFAINPQWNDITATTESGDTIEVVQNIQEIDKTTTTVTQSFGKKLLKSLDIPTLGKFTTDSDIRTKVSMDVTYEKWNKEVELEWWNKNLSGVPIQVLDNIHEIYRKGGFKTWGIFKNGAAYIWENAGTGTAYHEAFHSIFNLYLNENEKKLILDEAANIYSIPRNTQMDIAIEERLADDFSEYVQSQQASEQSLPSTIYNRVKNFIKNLYRLLKSMFTNDVNVDTLFSRINEGFYSKQPILSSNPYWTNPLTRFKLYIDPRKKEHYIRVINTQFFQELDAIRNKYEEYEGLNDIELINKWGKKYKMNGVLAVYSSVFNQLIEYYNDETNPTEARLELANEDNNGILDNYFTVEGGKITSLGDYLISSIINLSNYGLKVDIRNTNIEQQEDSPSDEKEFAIIEDENNYEGWEIKAVSVSGKETLSYEVRKLLRQTIDGKYDQEGNFIAERDPIFNKPVFVNFDELYNYLERNLSDIYDLKGMMSQLMYLQRYKPALESIYNKLERDEKLKSQFYVNFVKAHIKYTTVRQYIFENVDQYGEKYSKTTWKIFNSNRNEIKKLILNDWYSNFTNVKTGLMNTNGEINKERGQAILKEFEAITKKIATTRKVTDADYKTIADILFNIGIDLSVNELQSAFEDASVDIQGKKIDIPAFQNFRSLLSGGTDSIDVILRRLADGTNPFEGASTESAALGRLTSIRMNFSKDLIQSAFRNVENKSVYSHQNPTFLSKLITQLRDGSYIEKHFKDPYFQKNKWLQDINTDINIDFDYTYLDGTLYNDQQRGTKYTRMSPRDFEIASMNMWLGSEKDGQTSQYGFYRLPILADSPTLAFFKFKKYNLDEVIDALYQVSKQEFERIQTVKEERARGTEKIANYHSNTDFNFLQLFDAGTYESLTETRVRELITNWMNAQFEQEVQNLTKLGVVNDNSLGENISSRAREMYGDNDTNLLRHYFYNQVLGNIQLFQILHGDPSFYKTSDLYAGKRNNQVTKPGLVLNSEAIRPIYNTVYVQDIELDESERGVNRHYKATAEFTQSVENVLKDMNISQDRIDYILSQYNDINTTDAQSFIRLDRWKEIQTGLGRWTPTLDKAYNNLKNGKATPDDLHVVLQPIKPFYFEHHLINGKIIPTQNKNSESVLLPQLVNKSPLLTKLLDYMDKNDVDSVQFNSAVKVGGYGSVDINELIDGKAIPTIHKLSNDSYVIQQEVPEHHLDDQNLFGTQIRKLILADLNSKKKYINELTGEALVKLYNDLITANVIESYDETAGRFADLESLSKLIQEEVRSRKLGENTEELAALEYGPNGELRFKYPLYFPTQSQRTEALLSSVFKNNITKQKISGGSFVLVSNFGFSDNLKIVVNEKTKSIDYMEVYMPWWSDSFAPKLPNGEIDMSKIDSKLLEAIGYRIPTEGKYSIKKIKIKKFTPKEWGGSIILPNEITKISGEDFDIDKLYVMLQAFEVKGNRAVKIEYDYNKKPNENSKEARDNALIDIMSSVWSNSSSFEDIVEPGGFDKLKSIRNDINATPFNVSIALPMQQRSIFERNTTGSNLIGIFANHNVSHAVSQHFTLKFSKPIRFDSIKAYELNKKEDTTGNLISRNIATLVAASVDNAKDPVLNDLNVGTYTADILATILRTGFPLNTAIYFLNQPIVKEFMFRYNNQTGRKKEDRIYDELIEEYGAKYRELAGLDFLPQNSSNLKTSMMLNDINRAPDKFDDKYYRRQMRALKSFTEYKKISMSLTTYVQSTRPDNIGSSKSIAANRVYINRVNKMLDNPFFPISGVGKLFDEASPYSLVNSFYEYGIIKPTDIMNKLYPYNNNAFASVLRMLEYNKQGELTEEEINHMNKELIRFYMSEFFEKEEMMDLINDLPDRLETYKSKNTNKLGNYQIIASLRVQPPTNTNPYKAITFHNNVSLTNEQKNYLMDSLEYMANNGTDEERKLANDLIKYSFFTTGYQFSSKTFAHLIPHSYLRNIKNQKGEKFIDVLYRIQEESKDISTSANFISQYIRNFYKELDSIPKIKSFSKAISLYKTTQRGNITSIRIEANNLEDKSTFIGWDENGMPVFKPFISVIDNRGNTRLYQFTGISADTDNAGVFNLVSDLGIEDFAAEYDVYQVIDSKFESNGADLIKGLGEDYFFNTLDTIIEQSIDGTYKPDGEETQDNINKCES